MTDIRRTNSLFTVLALLDRHVARVPIASENLLTPLQGHRGMRCRTMAFVSRHIKANRVVNVILDCILLPGADGLSADLRLIWFWPQVPRVPRMPAILQ
jgi:hypothetical protein